MRSDVARKSHAVSKNNILATGSQNPANDAPLPCPSRLIAALSRPRLCICKQVSAFTLMCRGPGKQRERDAVCSSCHALERCLQRRLEFTTTAARTCKRCMDA
jgi:hypothetical protein